MSSEPFVPPFLRPWPEDAEVLTHTGGCHCRKFTYEFEHPALTARQPISCNCSICSKNAVLNLFADETRFRLTSGSLDEASKYLWGKKNVTRYFCPVCGINFLWKAFGKIGVNARTIDGIEIDKLEPTEVDGKNLL